MKACNGNLYPLGIQHPFILLIRMHSLPKKGIILHCVQFLRSYYSSSLFIQARELEWLHPIPMRLVHMEWAMPIRFSPWTLTSTGKTQETREGRISFSTMNAEPIISSCRLDLCVPGPCPSWAYLSAFLSISAWSHVVPINSLSSWINQLASVLTSKN